MAPDYWVFTGVLFGEEYASLNVCKNDLFLDVGANVGVTAVHFGLRAKAVIAIEPEPSNFTLLERNTAINGLAKAILHRQAATDTEGTEQIEGVGGLAHLSSTGQTITCTTIDAIVERSGVGPPTVMKMDIEGSEVRALQGFSGLGALREGVIEVHSEELLHGVKRILTEHGFIMYDVSHTSPLLILRSLLRHPVSFLRGEVNYRFEVTSGMLKHLLLGGPHPVAASNCGTSRYLIWFGSR